MPLRPLWRHCRAKSIARLLASIMFRMYLLRWLGKCSFPKYTLLLIPDLSVHKIYISVVVISLFSQIIQSMLPIVITSALALHSEYI